MTALPHPAPQPGAVPPLTLADYLALPEEPERRFELQEGALVVVPGATGGHQNTSLELAVQIRHQLRDDLKVLLDVDVNLDLVPPDQPATVRRPDLVVVPRPAFERTRDGGVLSASEVVLAVEIISPSSRRTDSVFKHSEYADAGIGHYWIVDLNGGPSLTACHLGGEFGYIDEGQVTGTFEVELPFPVRIDLPALLT
jgi:Uma2 family endonuclease